MGGVFSWEAQIVSFRIQSKVFIPWGLERGGGDSPESNGKIFYSHSTFEKFQSYYSTNTRDLINQPLPFPLQAIEDMLFPDHWRYNFVSCCVS